jgi:hypothetical protein
LKERDKLKLFTPESFEEHVAAVMKEIIGETVQYERGSSRFPDIAIPPYGIEVKFTKADKWTSTGNSILESSRHPDVKYIYLCFLKAGGVPDVLIKPYDKVMSEIVVTHYPRYRIDMTADKSIFDKMGIKYDDFRTEDPISKAKDYYPKMGLPVK